MITDAEYEEVMHKWRVEQSAKQRVFDSWTRDRKPAWWAVQKLIYAVQTDSVPRADMQTRFWPRYRGRLLGGRG